MRRKKADAPAPSPSPQKASQANKPKQGAKDSKQASADSGKIGATRAANRPKPKKASERGTPKTKKRTKPGTGRKGINPKAAFRTQRPFALRNLRRPIVRHWTETKSGPGMIHDTTWHEAFLDLFAQSLNVVACCDAIGIGRATFYRHLKDFPEFQQQFDDARCAAVEMVEGTMYNLCMDGSEGLIKFVLTHHAPERYQSKTKVIIMTDEQLRRFLENQSDERLESFANGEIPNSIPKRG